MSLWTRFKSWIDGEPPAATRAEMLSPEETFTSEVERILCEHPGVERVSRADDDFALSVRHSGEEHTLYLGNIFSETRELGPDERHACIERFCLTLIRPSPETPPWEEAKERLVPLIRGATLYAAAMRADIEFAKRPFVSMLVETVGLDSEEATLYVTGDMLSDWGVREEEAFAEARERLANAVTEVEIYDRDAAYALWHVASSDAYEPSRLVLPSWLAAFSDKVSGRPIAIIPERGTLIVGGDGDKACVRRLIELARRQFESSPRSISPVPYTVDDVGKVVPLTLPNGHPLAIELGHCHALLASTEYANQKAFLEDHLEEDVFVATFTGFLGEDGHWTSRSVWTRTVLTLLPATGEVYLLEDPEAMSFIRVPWAAIAELSPPCIALEPGLDPPRYRTGDWPSPAQFEALRKRALPTNA